VCFEQNLNAGDLDAVMALYEPNARFVARSGETIVGRDRIRDNAAAPSVPFLPAASLQGPGYDCALSYD
jgi:hypothetical protein